MYLDFTCLGFRNIISRFKNKIRPTFEMTLLLYVGQCELTDYVCPKTVIQNYVSYYV